MKMKIENIFYFAGISNAALRNVVIHIDEQEKIAHVDGAQTKNFQVMSYLVCLK
jgi:hypothetical protein